MLLFMNEGLGPAQAGSWCARKEEVTGRKALESLAYCFCPCREMKKVKVQPPLLQEDTATVATVPNILTPFLDDKCTANQSVFLSVLVSAGTELTLFSVAGTVLGFGFSVRTMLTTL